MEKLFDVDALQSGQRDDHSTGRASATLTTATSRPPRPWPPRTRIRPTATSVTFTATVTNQDPGATQGSGTVTFYDNGTALGTDTLAGGSASLTTVGPAGRPAGRSRPNTAGTPAAGAYLRLQHFGLPDRKQSRRWARRSLSVLWPTRPTASAPFTVWANVLGGPVAELYHRFRPGDDQRQRGDDHRGRHGGGRGRPGRRQRLQCGPARRPVVHRLAGAAGLHGRQPDDGLRRRDAHPDRRLQQRFRQRRGARQPRGPADDQHGGGLQRRRRPTPSPPAARSIRTIRSPTSPARSRSARPRWRSSPPTRPRPTGRHCRPSRPATRAWSTATRRKA